VVRRVREGVVVGVGSGGGEKTFAAGVGTGGCLEVFETLRHALRKYVSGILGCRGMGKGIYLLFNHGPLFTSGFREGCPDFSAHPHVVLR
jgi:hypothetical protein